jgi:hypothetical protein
MMTTDALDHAIAAHAKWKLRLKEAIDTGKSEWKVADVRTDQACELGNWLSTLPVAQRLSRHYEKVRTFHADFHKAAADVLELALAGRKDEALAAIAFGSRFLAVSSNLVLAITAWREDPARNPSAR